MSNSLAIFTLFGECARVIRLRLAGDGVAPKLAALADRHDGALG